MTILEWDQWVKQHLPLEAFKKMDASLNGLQVGRYDKKIQKISFALDACQASIQQAVQQQTDVLFVHHGLFWGQAEPIVGALYKRISLLAQHDIALYAVHLPLDAAVPIGNNASIAHILKLQNNEAFADIGIIGDLPKPLPIQQLADMLFVNCSPIMWNHTPLVQRIAILVGNGTKMIPLAIEAEADCYITGEASHQVFHLCQENSLSLIAGGHYQSEMIGLRAWKEWVNHIFPDIETELIDIPTGV